MITTITTTTAIMLGKLHQIKIPSHSEYSSDSRILSKLYLAELIDAFYFNSVLNQTKANITYRIIAVQGIQSSDTQTHTKRKIEMRPLF